MALIVGSRNSDLLNGGGEDDTIRGRAGNDSISGGDGDDLLDGGTGADILTGGFGHDTMYGGGGDDSITASFGRDRVFGGDGDDTIMAGGSIRSLIDGGAGDDIIQLSLEGTLAGGNGIDILVDWFAPRIDETANVNLGKMAEGKSVRVGEFLLSGFEAGTLRLSDGDNKVLTGHLDFDLYGGGGDDSLVGGDAHQVLRAGGGTNMLDGRGGNDTLDHSGGLCTLLGGAGNDVLYGGDGDLILGGAGIDTLNVHLPFSGETLDLSVLRGDGMIEWTDGTRFSEVERLTVDTSGGGHVLGDRRPIRVFGDGANDTFVGSNKSDTLFGDAGDDLLTGGGGGDDIFGGSGRDTFAYRSVSESLGADWDYIADLRSDDVVDLSGVDANTGVAGDQAFVIVDEFTGAAGELIHFYSTGFWIMGDVDGDGVADIVIQGGEYIETPPEFVL